MHTMTSPNLRTTINFSLITLPLPFSPTQSHPLGATFCEFSHLNYFANQFLCLIPAAPSWFQPLTVVFPITWLAPGHSQFHAHVALASFPKCSSNHVTPCFKFSQWQSPPFSIKLTTHTSPHPRHLAMVNSDDHSSCQASLSPQSLQRLFLCPWFIMSPMHRVKLTPSSLLGGLGLTGPQTFLGKGCSDTHPSPTQAYPRTPCTHISFRSPRALVAYSI